MRVRSIIAAIAALAAAGAGAAIPIASAASVPRGTTPPGVTLAVKASGAIAGKPSGLVPPRDRPPVKNGLGGGNLLYNGGPVQSDVREYVLFWGTWWQSTCSGEQGNGAADETYLYAYWHGMGAAGDNLSNVQTQYGDSAGNHPVYPTTLGHAFAGWATYCDPSVPPAATDAQLAAVAQAYAAYLTANGVTVNRSTQIDIVSPSGTNPGGGFGSQYCAYHNATTYNGAYLSWTNMPYLPDQGANCGAGFLPSGPDPAMQGWSIVGGHEYAESATDPFVTGSEYAWYDANGEEIGDKCAWTGIFTENTAAGSFVQQPEWDNASSSCSPGVHIADTITMQTGVNLTSVHGHPVLDAVYATSAHGFALTWAATGLPPGLHIHILSGVVYGIPAGRIGTTYTVHVRAFDSAYPYDAAVTVFTWKIT